MSAVFEVLPWNDLAAALMEDFAPLAPEDRNLARRAFLGHTDAALYRVFDTARFRLGVVAQLRAALARCPPDPVVTVLVGEPAEASCMFARLWERQDMEAAPTLTKTFRHPAEGEVTVACDTLGLVDRDQYLVLFSAQPGSSDADALDLLNILGAQADHGLR